MPRIDPTETERLLHEAAARGERIVATEGITREDLARLSARFDVPMARHPHVARLTLGASFLMVSIDPPVPGPGTGRPYARYCAGRIMSVTAGEDVVGEWLEAPRHQSGPHTPTQAPSPE